ncbi:MAG TPA: hypothetical protein VF702_11215 [Allosphingosinicella sp.]
MRTIGIGALWACVATGGSGATQAQAPSAAAEQAAAPAPQAQREFALSPEERTAFAPLLAAYNAAVAAGAAGQPADWAAVQALLPAAQAAAQGDDARYLLARIQLALSLQSNDTALKTTALDALIANPATTAEELPRYLNARAEIAFAAEDFAAAERIYQRLLLLTPGDQRVIGNLGVVRRRMGNTAGALDEILAVIAAQEAAGGVAEESLYRRARDSAHQARDRRAAELAVRLARNYPTPANWRDAVNLYRRISSPGPALALDTMRLARVTGALSGSNDYLAFAQMLDQAGLPGEAKAVIEEGIARGDVRAGEPGVAQMLATATRRMAEDRNGLDGQIAQARAAAAGRLARTVGDALYGYGRYREAADLYQAAMAKTGEDRSVLNLRLGAALFMAGDRAAAEAAFGAVTGPAADLARLWLAWLSRRTG